ncbi:hypothetical protein HZS_5035 [Henneguya salminicola]|nr:hypothetical protein HZS_5035 [Henneguya salminicola]
MVLIHRYEFSSSSIFRKYFGNVRAQSALMVIITEKVIILAQKLNYLTHQENKFDRPHELSIIYNPQQINENKRFHDNLHKFIDKLSLIERKTTKKYIFELLFNLSIDLNGAINENLYCLIDKLNIRKNNEEIYSCVLFLIYLRNSGNSVSKNSENYVFEKSILNFSGKMQCLKPKRKYDWISPNFKCPSFAHLNFSKKTWDIILEYFFYDLYPRPYALPYLSESSRDMITNVYLVSSHQYGNSNFFEISQKDFISFCFDALVAIPSVIVTKISENELELCETFVLRGFSVKAARNYCLQFCNCGVSYLKLHDISLKNYGSPCISNSIMNRFFHSLNKFLFEYHKNVVLCKETQSYLLSKNLMLLIKPFKEIIIIQNMVSNIMKSLDNFGIEIKTIDFPLMIQPLSPSIIDEIDKKNEQSELIVTARQTWLKCQRKIDITSPQTYDSNLYFLKSLNNDIINPLKKFINNLSTTCIYSYFEISNILTLTDIFNKIFFTSNSDIICDLVHSISQSLIYDLSDLNNIFDKWFYQRMIYMAVIREIRHWIHYKFVDIIGNMKKKLQKNSPIHLILQIYRVFIEDINKMLTCETISIIHRFLELCDRFCDGNAHHILDVSLFEEINQVLKNDDIRRDEMAYIIKYC